MPLSTRQARKIRAGLWAARYLEVHPNTHSVIDVPGGIGMEAYSRARLRFHPELRPKPLPPIPGAR